MEISSCCRAVDTDPYFPGEVWGLGISGFSIGGFRCECCEFKFQSLGFTVLGLQLRIQHAQIAQSLCEMIYE